MALPSVGRIASLLIVQARLDDQASVGLHALDATGRRTAGSMHGVAAAASAARRQIVFMSLAAIGSVGALNKEFASFNRQAGITAIVANQWPDAVGEFQDLAFDLSETLARSPKEMIQLSKSIAQFGLTTRREIEPIAEWSTRLAIIGEVDAPTTAESLFRLATITTDSVEEAAASVGSLAGAVFLAGSAVTAGIPQLLRFIETFSAVGVQADLTGEQIIAISAAIADLTPRFREISTTAALRIFSTEEFAQLAQLFGTTEEEVKRRRRDEPLQFFLDVLTKASEASKDQRLASFMKDLGLGELRSIRGIAAELANLERLTESGDRNLVELVSDPIRNVNALTEASENLLTDNQAAWDRLTAAFERFRLVAGGLLSNVMVPLLGAMTGLAQAAQNPALLAVLTTFGTIALLGAGRSALGMVSRFGGQGLGLLGLGGAFRGGFGAAGRMAGLSAFQSKMAPGVGLGARTIGAGVLGRIGLSGLAGSLAGRMATGGFGGRLAGGALGLAGSTVGRAILGPVGWVFAAAQLLTPVLDKIGDAFQTMSARGGVMGAIFATLATIFKVIELAGNVVLLVFDKIGDFFRTIFEFFRPGGTAFASGIGDFNSLIDKWNSDLVSARGGQRGGTTNVNVGVYSTQNRDGLDATFSAAAKDLAFSINQSRTV